MSILLDIAENITPMLAEFETANRDRGPLMAAIKQAGITSIMGNFEAGGRPEKWQPLAGPRSYYPKGTTTPVLVASATMMQSIYFDSTVIDDETVELMTNAEQAAALHFGFDDDVEVPEHSRTINQAFGRRLAQPVTFQVSAHKKHLTIPARPFVVVQDEDLDDIGEMIADYYGGGQ